MNSVIGTFFPAATKKSIKFIRGKKQHFKKISVVQLVSGTSLILFCYLFLGFSNFIMK